MQSRLCTRCLGDPGWGRSYLLPVSTVSRESSVLFQLESGALPLLFSLLYGSVVMRATYHESINDLAGWLS